MITSRVVISKDNIDEATAAELQKYMEDHGIIDIRMRKNPGLGGWFYTVVLLRGSVLAGGPLKEMSDCMKDIIRKVELEEA